MFRAFALGSLVALLSLAGAGAVSHAQAPSSPGEPQAAILADMQNSVARIIGAEANTVEVKVNRNILVVERVNSNMNNATHSARDNEATAIAGVVSKAIAGKPEFGAVVSLQVQYLIRQASDKDGKVVDTVEFRKDPGGGFQFHKT